MKALKLTLAMGLMLVIPCKSFAQSIADELRANQERQQANQRSAAQQEQQAANLDKKIKKEAFIVVCDDIGGGYYAFLDKVVYFALKRQSYYSLNEVTFNVYSGTLFAPQIFKQKGDAITWVMSFSNSNLTVSDKYEFYPSTMKMFRKTKSGSIYENQCNKVPNI